MAIASIAWKKSRFSATSPKWIFLSIVLPLGFWPSASGQIKHGQDYNSANEWARLSNVLWQEMNSRKSGFHTKVAASNLSNVRK